MSVLLWYNENMNKATQLGRLKIPSAVRACLWSYDVDKLDIWQDKERIITNVLNYGTTEATDWLRRTYSREEIAEVLRNPRPGEWDKKSLNYWALIYDVSPQVKPGTQTR